MRKGGGAWGATLEAAAAAVAEAAERAGSDSARVRALRDELASGRLFPLSTFGARRSRPEPTGERPWPPRGIYPAADGWLVAGPSRLPAATLLEVLGAPAGCAAGDRLAAWTSGQERERAAHALQELRTYFAPVLEPGEARALRASEGDGGAPVPARSRNRAPEEMVVLDLTHLWAGPLSTGLLAELGATVVKVEGPRRPDPLRGAAPPPGHPTFDALNAGKLCLALDLDSVAGRATFLALLDAADLVVDNFSRRAWSNWDLDRAALATGHDLLWVSMTAFSARSPYASFGARGAAVEGTSGLAAHYAELGTPRLLGAPLADPLMGLRATAAALSAPGPGLLELHQNAVAGGAMAAVAAAGETAPPAPAPITPPRAAAARLGEHTALVERLLLEPKRPPVPARL